MRTGHLSGSTTVIFALCYLKYATKRLNLDRFIQLFYFPCSSDLLTVASRLKGKSVINAQKNTMRTLIWTSLYLSFLCQDQTQPVIICSSIPILQADSYLNKKILSQPYTCSTFATLIFSVVSVFKIRIYSRINVTAFSNFCVLINLSQVCICHFVFKVLLLSAVMQQTSINSYAGCTYISVPCACMCCGVGY